MVGKLTKQIESLRQNMNIDNIDEVQNPVDFSQIIGKIESVLTTENKKRKSKLTGDNIKGIMQLSALNNFLEKNLGKEFRIDIYDKLIEDKLDYVVSYEGKGINDIIRGLSIIQPNVVGQMPATVIDRSLGNNPQRIRDDER